MLNSGDVVLAEVQFTDSSETKVRPCLVLFEELGNVIVAGITSNTEMIGIPLTKKEGAIKDSVIKLNYIFTISPTFISKALFTISNEKKKIVYDELEKRISGLDKQV